MPKAFPSKSEYLTRKQIVDCRLRAASWTVAPLSPNRVLSAYKNCAIEEYPTEGKLTGREGREYEPALVRLAFDRNGPMTSEKVSRAATTASNHVKVGVGTKQPEPPVPTQTDAEWPRGVEVIQMTDARHKRKG
jgi:hypothetical protein